MSPQGRASRGRVLIVGPVPEHEGGRSTGGIATHVVELARALRTLDWDVAVFGDNMPPAAEATVTEWGALYAPLPLSRTPLGLRALATPRALGVSARVLRSLPKLKRLGKGAGPMISKSLGLALATAAHRPDVIHHHQPDFRPLYARFAGVERIPQVQTLHSLSRFAADESTALGELTLENMRRADALVAVSDDVRDGLRRIDADLHPTVVPNGVDLGTFRARPRPARDGRAPRLLYVGRVNEDKGVGDLLVAFGALTDAFPGTTLTIVGPEDDFDRERVLASSAVDRSLVTFAGSLAPREIADLLAECDALAMPSRLREGQPRVLIEAMAAGVPIVATDVGSIAELTGNGTAALLVPPADPPALAEALRTILTDGSLAERLSKAAAERASAFDVMTVARRLEGVYRDARARAGR